MKKHIENQPENKVADPIMRRGFLKAATLLGLGGITAGPLQSYAAAKQVAPKKKNVGTILTKKRTLGSKTRSL